MTIAANHPTMAGSSGLTAEELAILDPPPVPSIVDWAPENLILPNEESPIEGFFSYDHSAWMVEIHRWAEDPGVREITVMAPLQSGKTLVTRAWLCHAIRFRPANTVVVMTDENTLKRTMKRLRALWRANDFLLERVGGKIENLHIGEATELPRMLLYLAWSNSAAAMASDPIPYVIADEVALWQPTVGNTDIHALHHLRGRQSAFPHTSKLFKISSPRNVGDEFDQEFMAGDRCEYWVPCHKCRFWTILNWHEPGDDKTRAVLDRDPHGDWLPIKAYEDQHVRHVHYLCPSCGVEWSDPARDANVKKGRWLPDGVTMGPGGTPSGVIEPQAYKSCRVRGLMVNSRLRSIKRMAAQWVRGQMQLKGGRKSAFKHFINNIEGFSWKEERADTDVARLKTHIGGYRTEDIVTGRTPMPWGVQVLVMGVDVHADWFRVVIDGYGRLFESWQIEVLRIDTGDTTEVEAFAPLVGMLTKYWPVADGSWLPLSAVAIDSGYRPEAVKTFCRANRHLVYNCNLWPIRGSPRRMNRLYQKYAEDDTLAVYELNPLLLKDQMHRMLFEAQQPGGGYKHLPADITGETISELCSEHKVIVDGWPSWVPKADGRDNHSWDVSYYNLWAAQRVGVGSLEPLAAEPVRAASNAPATSARTVAPTRPIRRKYDY